MQSSGLAGALGPQLHAKNCVTKKMTTAMLRERRGGSTDGDDGDWKAMVRIGMHGELTGYLAGSRTGESCQPNFIRAAQDSKIELQEFPASRCIFAMYVGT